MRGGALHRIPVRRISLALVDNETGDQAPLVERLERLGRGTISIRQFFRCQVQQLAGGIVPIPRGAEQLSIHRPRLVLGLLARKVSGRDGDAQVSH